MSRLEDMRLTLNRAQQQRYFKVKGWFRDNVNKNVNQEAETYILERIKTAQPMKGSELKKLGAEPRNSAQHVTINFWEEDK